MPIAPGRGVKLKNLFYCHSALTALVAYSTAVSLFEGTNAAGVIWGRGVHLPDMGMLDLRLSRSAEGLASHPTYGGLLLAVRKGRQIAEVDRLLTNFAEGEGIRLFLPSTRNFLMQVLATSSSVKELHFLEEGLLSYTGRYRKEVARKYTRIELALSWHRHGGRSEVYRPRSFAVDAEICTVNSRFSQEFIGAVPRYVPMCFPPSWVETPVGGCMSYLVLDAIVENNFCSVEGLLGVLEMYFVQHRQHDQFIRVRFHPAQRIQSRILELLDRLGVRYEVDDAKMPFECLLAKIKGIRVVGFHSSLLFYAALAGAHVESLASELAAADDAARHWYDVAMPKVFFESVPQWSAQSEG